MGRDDSDLDRARAAFVFSWSRYSTGFIPGRLKTCPTKLRRDTRPFAEPHAESDATPQSRDRCCRKQSPRRSRRRRESSRTHAEQPNQLVTRSRPTTDRSPPSDLSERTRLWPDVINTLPASWSTHLASVGCETHPPRTKMSSSGVEPDPRPSQSRVQSPTLRRQIPDLKFQMPRLGIEPNPTD